jgi:hypothetical protein
MPLKRCGTASMPDHEVMVSRIICQSRHASILAPGVQEDSDELSGGRQS